MISLLYARTGAVRVHGRRMFRRKPAPDLIRCGRRFADENMRKQKGEHVAIPQERNML
jgi:hypothetical protein